MAIDPDKIEELAEAPKRTRTDEGTVQERDVSELMDADRYSKTQAAADDVPWGIRVAKVKPRGPV